MKIITVVIDNERFHILDGSKIQCSSTKDCQFCIQEKSSVIESWIEKHNPICILCDEKPPCYSCLRNRCKEWCKDKNWIEENGSHYGCCHSFNRTYCADFECKYGFLGWWMDGWLDAFEKRGKTIDDNFLREIKKRKKEEFNGAKKNSEEPTRKPITRKASQKKPAT